MLSAATRGFTAFRSAPVARPGHVSVVAPSLRPSEQSAFMGGSMMSCGIARAPARGSLVVMAGTMARTIDGKGSNKGRKTTSGFRARMATPGGKKVLQARRKKGRKVLCPASLKSSAGKK